MPTHSSPPHASSPLSAVISANGKRVLSTPMLRELAENNKIETLEITIDGKSLLGGSHQESILGNLNGFLPASIAFQLTDFKPLANGQCQLTYTRSD